MIASSSTSYTPSSMVNCHSWAHRDRDGRGWASTGGGTCAVWFGADERRRRTLSFAS